jgi:hypothetical protein
MPALPYESQIDTMGVHCRNTKHRQLAKLNFSSLPFIAIWPRDASVKKAGTAPVNFVHCSQTP